VKMDKENKKRKTQKSIKSQIIDERGLACERCGKKVKKSKSLYLHHLSYEYYATSNFSHYILLCKNCHVKLYNKIKEEEQKYAGDIKIVNATTSLLDSLHVPMDDPNFKDTPKRVARMYKELCFGLFLDIKKEIEEILSTVFPSDNDEMIIYEGRSVGMCPHHLLPVLYKFDIGIIPNGFVVGASKPQRIVDLFCSIPDIQEDITVKVKQVLQDTLHPKGIIVLMEGEHMCMRIRGVKSSNAIIKTSSLSGSFTKNSVRNEFLSLLPK